MEDYDYYSKINKVLEKASHTYTPNWWRDPTWMEELDTLKKETGIRLGIDIRSYREMIYLLEAEEREVAINELLK